MKFARYLAANKEEAWRDDYLRYAELKKLLVQILEAGAPVSVPTSLSLSSTHKADGLYVPTPQEQFFLYLEADVKRINDFTTRVAVQLRARLRDVAVGMMPQPPGSAAAAAAAVAARAASAAGASSSGTALPCIAAAGGDPLADGATRERLLAAARRLGEEYLRLEKYVNINYTGLQKILKKHDKLIPAAPCWQFYKLHINRQPWVRGDYHDIQVTLSRTFSQLHSASFAAAGPASAAAAASSSSSGPSPAPPQQHHKEFTRATFWVRADRVAEVKHILMQHLSVLPPPTNAAAGPPGSAAGGASALWAECDAASRDIVNTMFLDNPSLELYHNLLYGRPYAATLQLRWYGSRMPDTVTIVRQIHREGWRPEDCAEDSFPIQETRVSEFLNGRWTWADARKLMMPEGEEEERAGHHRSNRHGHTHAQGQASRLGQASPARGGGAVGTSGRGGQEASPAPHQHQGHRQQQHHHHSPPAAPDPARLAQEYQLFKTFTEVARLVESKGLQPMVQVRLRHTAFRQPCDEHGLTAILEEEVQMLLEYAYDTSTRLTHGIWRQEHPADAIEFPYAVLKLQRPEAEDERPPWLQALLRSGLLREMNDFSKFLHACAGLLPDMVRAVPQWVDDDAVQKSLYANVAANEDLQALLLAGHNVVAEMEEGVLGKARGGRAQPAAAAAAHAELRRGRGRGRRGGAGAGAGRRAEQPRAPERGRRGVARQAAAAAGAAGPRLPPAAHVCGPLPVPAQRAHLHHVAAHRHHCGRHRDGHAGLFRLCGHGPPTAAHPAHFGADVLCAAGHGAGHDGVRAGGLHMALHPLLRAARAEV